jgi:hypothetical protein
MQSHGVVSCAHVQNTDGISKEAGNLTLMEQSTSIAPTFREMSARRLKALIVFFMMGEPMSSIDHCHP